ncbi:DUF4114 domain-containing protein [Nostoc sp. LEGE 12450]|uniref:DUF4114 domain-containing protein n=1 Tax=Nostoc sp. LEGE 12450 TaxID=1828643 RepID=UPI001881E66F|nr:DUF4114 domain-containing protein [Nostoc sp. LEGE 12450]MBE8986549.1 DUF4114 domain-containing protein [Nostoc sp. LEGE 12450]
MPYCFTNSTKNDIWQIKILYGKSKLSTLGNNTFGFEDLANDGDKNYNDTIMRVNLSVNAV